jgi:hypothetical protein
MSEWEVAILKSIKDLGGEARSIDICERTSKFIQLTARHGEITYGRPRYYHGVRSYLSNLLDDRYVIRKAKGVYSLTPAGMAAIKSN